LETFGQLGFFRALGLHLLLHQGGFFGGGALLNFRHLELAGQLLLFVLGNLVVFRELGELLLERGSQIRLFFNFSFHRREFFLRHQGFRGTALQFLVENLDVGLGRGKLLLQVRSNFWSRIWMLAWAAANCCCKSACCFCAASRTFASSACNCSRFFCSSLSASFMTAARSFPPVSDGLGATSTLAPGCAPSFSPAILLRSVENVSRLNSRKSQMTIRMLRFMTA